MCVCVCVCVCVRVCVCACVCVCCQLDSAKTAERQDVLPWARTLVFFFWQWKRRPQLNKWVVRAWCWVHGILQSGRAKTKVHTWKIPVNHAWIRVFLTSIAMIHHRQLRIDWATRGKPLHFPQLRHGISPFVETYIPKVDSKFITLIGDYNKVEIMRTLMQQTSPINLRKWCPQVQWDATSQRNLFFPELQVPGNLASCTAVGWIARHDLQPWTTFFPGKPCCGRLSTPEVVLRIICAHTRKFHIVPGLCSSASKLWIVPPAADLRSCYCMIYEDARLSNGQFWAISMYEMTYVAVLQASPWDNDEPVNNDDLFMTKLSTVQHHRGHGVTVLGTNLADMIWYSDKEPTTST